MAMKCNDPHEFRSARRHISDIVFCEEATDFYTASLESSLQEVLNSLRQSNLNDDLTKPLKRLEKMTGRLYHIMRECISDVDANWGVLCHGDLWVNNLLFSYDESNAVQGVKLVDLQTMRYASPVIDILHFIYTSTELSLREKYLDQLLADYATSLFNTVQQLNENQDTSSESASSMLEAIRSQFRDKALYGLGICLWLMPAVTFHADQIPDLDTIVMSDFKSSKQEKTMTKMQTPEYHVRVKETVLEFYSKGYLNSLA